MAEDKAPGEVTNEKEQSGSTSEVDLTPSAPKVAAAKNALIGDENQPDPREVEVDVYKADVAAQTVADKVEPVDTVPVYEVSVKTDEVITDPHSPLAVQVPDAGRGTLSLPIHAFVGARTVEEVFAEEAGENADES